MLMPIFSVKSVFKLLNVYVFGGIIQLFFMQWRTVEEEKVQKEKKIKLVRNVKN